LTHRNLSHGAALASTGETNPDHPIDFRFEYDLTSVGSHHRVHSLGQHTGCRAGSHRRKIELLAERLHGARRSNCNYLAVPALKITSTGND